MLPTYCNPLCVEKTPAGRWLDTAGRRDLPDYRSIADPSVIFHEGKWYLYASYGLAHVSEDFVHWKQVDIGVPHVKYSPAVVLFRGKWYLQGHGMSEVYVADDPLGPFTLCGHLTDIHGELFKPMDGCFLADGDRLYFYCYKSRPANEGENVDRITGTIGMEMDPEKPWQCITDYVWLNCFDPSIKWQCSGEFNQNKRSGWIEGQWAFKIGSRYYMLYSGSGTEYSSYATGILYSDEGPLSGFKMQKRNNGLLSEKRTGLLRGAGHGSIAQGPGGTYWLFYTIVFRYYNNFERRISMDPVGIDENGEFYCDYTTEIPQFAPGVSEHPENGNDAGLLPVTSYQATIASSYIEGRNPLYAVDESTQTWWQPASGDTERTLLVVLGNTYKICSARILWRDIGMDTDEGIMPGPFQYMLEALCPDDNEWKVLVDASKNADDLCVDYRTFCEVNATAVRIRILGAPEGIEPGLVNLTVFGRM